MNLFNAYRLIIFNALITLVLTVQDCFEELFETVNITRRIHLAASFRLSDQRLEKPDGRTYTSALSIPTLTGLICGFCIV